MVERGGEKWLLSSEEMRKTVAKQDKKDASVTISKWAREDAVSAQDFVTCGLESLKVESSPLRRWSVQ